MMGRGRGGAALTPSHPCYPLVVLGLRPPLSSSLLSHTSWPRPPLSQVWVTSLSATASWALLCSHCVTLVSWAFLFVRAEAFVQPWEACCLFAWEASKTVGSGHGVISEVWQAEPGS